MDALIPFISFGWSKQGPGFWTLFTPEGWKPHWFPFILPSAFFWTESAPFSGVRVVDWKDSIISFNTDSELLLERDGIVEKEAEWTDLYSSSWEQMVSAESLSDWWTTSSTFGDVLLSIWGAPVWSGWGSVLMVTSTTGLSSWSSVVLYVSELHRRSFRSMSWSTAVSITDGWGWFLSAS